jgi:[acyl-carrier-protein] S-malonyltransferase
MTIEKKIFAVFPGQGSQKVGMGQDLYNSNELAKDLFHKADKVLSFELSKICFEGPAEKLTMTDIAQPAILLTSIISYSLASDEIKKQILVGAGHSLGEYSALVAAGTLSLEDAILLVHKRGCYMQEAVPSGVGKMAAILSKEVAEIEDAIKKVSCGCVSIANINAPGQVVIAGDTNAVDEAISNLGTVKAIPLQVSAPFHCPLMKPAEISLSKDLDALTFKDAKFPVISNFTAKATQSAAELKQNLKDQVCGRVRWVESTQLAAEQFGITSVYEFGAGNVLTGLIKRIDSNLERVNIYSGQE